MAPFVSAAAAPFTVEGRFSCAEILQRVATSYQRSIVVPDGCRSDTTDYYVKNADGVQYITAWGKSRNLRLTSYGRTWYYLPDTIPAPEPIDSMLWVVPDTAYWIQSRDSVINRLFWRERNRLDYLLIIDEVSGDSLYNRGIQYSELLATFSSSGYSISASASLFYGRYSTSGHSFHAIPISVIDSARVEWGETRRDTTARVDMNGQVIQQFQDKIIGDRISLLRRHGLITYNITVKQISDGLFTGQIHEGEELHYSREMTSKKSGWSWFPLLPWMSDGSKKVVSSVYLLPYNERSKGAIQQGDSPVNSSPVSPSIPEKSGS